MAQNIKLKRSALAGKVPNTSSIDLGEIAINTYDGKVFFKKSGSVHSVEQIVATNSITTGSITLTQTGSFGELVVTQDGNFQRDIYVTNDIIGNGYIDILGTFTASLQQGYVWVGNSSGKTSLIATSSLGSSVNISSLNSYTASNDTKWSTLTNVTSSVLTFTGSQETKNLTLAGLTGSFATTGSNIFKSDQTISGSVSISGSLTMPIFSSGSVIFAGANGILSQSNSNLFWDNTNGRLGIGMATPSNALHVNGAVRGTTLLAATSATIGSATTANASSVLDLISTTKGLLPPRTDLTSNIATPVQGLITYLTGSTNEGVYYYSSGSIKNWTRLLNDTGSQIISGSLTTTNGITGSIAATNGVVSGSSQIFASSTQNFVSDVQTVINGLSIISGSSDSNNIDFIQTGGTLTANLKGGVISGSSQITAILPTGVVSGSSQVSIAGTSDYTSLFTGIASSTSSLNTFTASNANTSLNTYTGSVSDPKFVSIGASTSSLNTFSASVSSSILNLNTYSASVSNSIQQLNTFTASNATTSLNTYTGSISDPKFLIIANVTASLNSFTSSATPRLTNLETTTASLNISVSSLNSKTGSYATTGSNAFIGNQTISGNLTIGSASVATENTLLIGPPPAGGTGEGGQILLAASGGLYTSASMLDNWQNSTRLLRGSNAGSDAVVTQWNMHTKQISFPAYNSVSAFSGTAIANLAVDNIGNILTVSTSVGSVFPYTGIASINGGLLVTGSITASGAIYAQANGQMYFRGGDDAELWDINVANTVGIYGQQDATIASIKLGSGGGTISGKNGNIGVGTINPTSGSLHVNGNIFATSITGAIVATNGVISGSSQISLAGTSDYTSLFGGIAASTSSLNTYTGSISDPKFLIIANVTASLNSFTSSATPRLTNLETTSASVNISVSNLNTYSASVSNSIQQINSFTASTANTSLNTFSASANISITNLNSYSASISNSIQQLSVFTSSASGRLSNIELITASLIIDTNNLELYTSSVSNSIQQLSVFTGSQITKNLTLAGLTGSFATTGSNNFIGNNTVTGSLLVSGSTNLNGNTTITGSTLISGSLNISGGITGSLQSLKAASGSVASFSGAPKTSSVTFASAFANNLYAVTVTGEDARLFTIQSKTSAGFTINSNSSVALTGPVYWIATAYN